MSTIFLAIGLVLCIEGLVFALAPKRVEDIIKMLAELPFETRRMIGLGALGLGVLLIWLSNTL